MLAAGIHRDVPMADYLALPAVGAHDLWTMREHCPAVARWNKDHPNHETAAKSFGTAMHTLTLEPDAFAARYAVRPVDGPRGNSNAYKEWAAEHIQAGREIISADDWAQMQAMRAALPKAARKLLTRGRPEVTAVCQHEHTGLWLKTRPDWLRDEGIVINLKTAQDVRPGAWTRQAGKLGYHASAAVCVDVLRELTSETWEYWWLVVSKEPPWIAYLHQAEPIVLEAGRQQYHRELMRWAECERAGRWPAYGDIVKHPWPDWALKVEETV